MNEEHRRLTTMMDKGQNRLIIDLDNLRKSDEGLHKEVLATPAKTIGAFEKALTEMVSAALLWGRGRQHGVRWPWRIETRCAPLCPPLNSPRPPQVKDIDPNWLPEHQRGRGDRLRVGFEGNLGAAHVGPRELSSRLLNHTVCVDGIITKCERPFRHYVARAR